MALFVSVVSPALGRRIIGGSNAQPCAWPWQGSLQSYSQQRARYGGEYYGHFCGAALLSTQWALTAAHCVDR